MSNKQYLTANEMREVTKIALNNKPKEQLDLIMERIVEEAKKGKKAVALIGKEYFNNIDVIEIGLKELGYTFINITSSFKIREQILIISWEKEDLYD